MSSVIAQCYCHINIPKSCTLTEVDDLTSDASYVNIAMETNQQKTSVEIHRTFEEEKSADNNNSKKEKEKQSITVCITRK